MQEAIAGQKEGRGGERYVLMSCKTTLDCTNSCKHIMFPGESCKERNIHLAHTDDTTLGGSGVHLNSTGSMLFVFM